MIIPILAQTPFNYSYLVSTTESLIVADRIPVWMARSINLSIRIHRLSLPGGGQFVFNVYGVNPSASDGTPFVTSTTIGNTAGITTASPNLVSLAAVINEPAHPFVRVVMSATGPGSASTVYGEFSADIVLRTGRDDMQDHQVGEASVLRALSEAVGSSGLSAEARAELREYFAVGPAGGQFDLAGIQAAAAPYTQRRTFTLLASCCKKCGFAPKTIQSDGCPPGPLPSQFPYSGCNFC
jgi:hypothetical protein